MASPIQEIGPLVTGETSGGLVVHASGAGKLAVCHANTGSVGSIAGDAICADAVVAGLAFFRTGDASRVDQV